jgi:hypothetical protein
MENRLLDPSKICALEFKGEFRRFKIRSISATIGIDRSDFDSAATNRDPLGAGERPSTKTERSV